MTRFSSVRNWYCLLALTFSGDLLADVQSFQQSFYEPDYDKAFVIADYSYFDEGFDALGYADKLNSSFRPKLATSIHVGFGFKFLDRLVLSYQRERSKGEVTRDREPFLLSSEVNGDRLGARWKLGDVFDIDWTVEVAFSQREQPSVSVSCYEYQNLVFGSCASSTLTFTDPETDAPMPLLTSSAEHDAWLLGLYANHSIFERLNLTHHVVIKQSELAVNSTSPLFDIQSNFLLNSTFGGRRLGDVISDFSKELPQQTPWEETSIRYGVSASLPLTERWIFNAQLALLKVTRSGYQQLSGKPNYERNSVLSSSLWFTPKRNLSFYVEGMLTNRYLLGLDELTYNQRTAKFFKYPFGQLKAGIVVGL